MRSRAARGGTGACGSGVPLPEGSTSRRASIVNRKKSQAIFSIPRLRLRRQKAWFLPPASARSYGRGALANDLAAARGTGPDAAATDIRHHDARSRFAAHLARLVDGLLERGFHAFRKFPERLIERLRLDVEHERQHARRREQLRLPGEQHFA